MRLLAHSEQMSYAELLRANSFAEWLLTVGEGRDNTTPLTELPVGMSPMKCCINLLIVDLCMSDGRETVQDLIEEIYPDLHDITTMSETMTRQYFSQRVILAARNIDVDAVNDAVLKKHPDNPKVYASADCAFNDAGVLNDAIPNEYLNTIVVSGMPLHETILKLNCPIILLRNLN